MARQSLAVASDETLDGKSIAAPDAGCRAPSDGNAARRAALLRRLAVIERERIGLIEDLAALDQITAVPPQTPSPVKSGGVTMASPAAEKIALFRGLFRGREDVFPRRWENVKTGKSGYAPVCRNEWVRRVCEKPRIRCSECVNQAFVPIDDGDISAHLLGRAPGAGGDFTVGLYAMLSDEHCWFLAVDFDKAGWQRDVAAVRDAARSRGIPIAVERSRSGNGAHAWIFFAEPVPAVDARRLGALLVTAAMEAHPDLGFDSYDRFFPSQDTMPSGGFGNLIALPLQRGPRDKGNSVFVDDTFQQYPDQWAYLGSIERVSRSMLDSLIAQNADVLGVRLPSIDEDDEPWKALPSRRQKAAPITGKIPSAVDIVLGNQIYVDRRELPPALVNRMMRLAAFQNPEFYAAQAMRLPTFGKPRIISCAELFAKHVALPRGCLDDLERLLDEIGVSPRIRDEREPGTPIVTRFLGELTPEQDTAVSNLLRHDIGVLAATTAFGKTVVAARLIAERSTNTLVLVHRRQLLDQWVARLRTFLDIDSTKIGVIQGGKRKPSGLIDIGLMQSLVRKGDVDDVVAEYGHIVVDECHHLSAVGFEAIARAAKARHVLGLSATVTRKDGHHPIIFMQCGAVRHRVDARKQAAARPFTHNVVFRHTEFRLARSAADQKPSIQDLYAGVAQDSDRNDMIFNDVLASLEAGRSPVVITERKEHLQTLADRLARFAKNVVVLRGGLGARQSRAALDMLANIPQDEERVLVATGRYLGEGFDDARLDTLFLTMPISWRGTLAQYAGRLHRLHHAKREVRIYDYVDVNEPMLANMARKRLIGYRGLGYATEPDHEIARRH
jgi:superfamily II DNA or RNA helicase